MTEGRNRRSAALVIIPAFNEEEALPSTLAELAEVRPDLDVLVVSDGSVDKTAALARAAGVGVVELPFNLGIGGALQTGFRYAALDDGAAMVVGSRFGEGNVEYRVGPVRKAAMAVLRAAVNKMAHQKFSDTSSGFRAFNASVLQTFARSYPVEFMDSTESLVQAINEGYRVVEVPTRIRARTAGQPSTRHVRLVYHYFRLMIVLVSQLPSRRRQVGTS